MATVSPNRVRGSREEVRQRGCGAEPKIPSPLRSQTSTDTAHPTWSKSHGEELAAKETKRDAFFFFLFLVSSLPFLRFSIVVSQF